MRHLIILHGAIGASVQLLPLAEALGDTYKVHTPDFSGHGNSPLPDAPFSIPLFAADVLRYMEQHQLDKVSVLGYSMGGYAGMYLAIHHPGKIDRLIALGTKYEWSEAIAAKEIQMMDPGKIALKLPAFAATLAERHAVNGWKTVLARTTELMTAMGNDNPIKQEDYARVAIPVLLLLGDRDKMSGLEETAAVYRLLPDAQMGMLPGTPHPIEQVDIPMLSFMVKRFLK